MARKYDPAKRRAYYLRTRNLKGRKKGAGRTKKGRVPQKAAMPAAQKEHLKQVKEQIQANTKAQREALSALLKEKVAAVREKIKQLRALGDTAGIEQLKQQIAGIQVAGKKAREAISENHQQKTLDVENKARSAAGMPPKQPPKKRIAATPTTTKLESQYSNMIPK